MKYFVEQTEWYPVYKLCTPIKGCESYELSIEIPDDVIDKVKKAETAFFEAQKILAEYRYQINCLK